MRALLCILLICFGTTCLAQDPIQLIGRNTGKKLLSDGNEIRTFGFAQEIGENPGVPGPSLEVIEGDSVVIDFWNISQGAPHTIHLHGLDVDQQNDGVPHLSFEVHHMEHGFYRFKAPHPGTYLYHCHVVSSIHVQAGMFGLLIVRPAVGDNYTWEGGYNYWYESSLLMSEIDTNWHHDSVLLHDYDTNMSHHHVRIPKYKPQHFLINGLAEQQLDDLTIRGVNDGNLYLRLSNIGYFGNRIIFPSGLNARVIDSDGRPLPVEEVTDTLEILPGERYGVLAAPDSAFMDEVIAQYFNLNTGIVLNEQYVNVNIEDAAGIKESSKEVVRIYPNPATSSLTVEVGLQEAEIQIVDSQGRLILETSVTGSESFDIRNLPSGAYILSSRTALGIENHPFIKP